MKLVNYAKFLVAVLATLASLIPLTVVADEMPAQAGAASPQPAVFNFGWSIKGDRSVAPTQVFDDGSKVYLQFADERHVPVIMASTAGGQILLAVDTTKPPYIIIDHFESSLEFRSNGGHASANRTRGVAREEAVSTGAAAPLMVTGAAEAPVSLEELARRRRMEDTQAGTTPYLPNVPTALAFGQTALPGAPIGPANVRASALAEVAPPKAVRDLGTNRTQLLFDNHPADVTFIGDGGVPLMAEWDATGRVATLPAQTQLVVRQRTSSYQITRTVSVEFQYDAANGAGLTDVFERDGATYLNFQKAPRHLRVTASGIAVRAAQRGRYFRVATVSPTLDLSADGKTATVTRVEHSQFVGKAQI